MWRIDGSQCLSRWTKVLAAFAILTLAGCGSEADKPKPKIDRYVKVSPSAEDAATAIRNGAVLAEEHGLKTFVYFTASWCPPCQAIKESMDDWRMRDAFKGTYILEFDMDEWKELPEGYEVDAIPVFFAVNAQGKPIGIKIDGSAWEENTPENMARPLGDFFQTDWSFVEGLR